MGFFIFFYFSNFYSNSSSSSWGIYYYGEGILFEETIDFFKLEGGFCDFFI